LVADRGAVLPALRISSRIGTVTSSQPTVPLDVESRQWLESLAPGAAARDAAIARLQLMLLRAARAELNRRAHRAAVCGPELDDLAHQAADDAVVSVCRKLGEFRGASRFTTWAYKFAILEVSSKLGRHYWQRAAGARAPDMRMDVERWALLPDRFGLTPESAALSADLLREVRRVVTEELTDRQRRVFVAIVVDAVPLDALVLQLGSNRNAIYKTMYEARRKIRQTLVANGYLDDHRTRA
jgi:RNA polymerase sigma-70 factor (ECF subfamily)